MKKLMKQTALICALIFSITLFSYGQFQIGAMAGINSSTQSELGNIWNNEGICCHLNAGLISRFKLNDWFALKAGALYSQKGRSLKLNENSVEIKRMDKFTYLEIPVKAEFSTPVGNQKIFVAAGPYAGFLLNSEKVIDNITTSLEDMANKTDFGVSMEIGLEIPVSEHAVQLSLNYNMGLSEIADYDTSLRNKSLSLNIGWFF